MGSDQRSIGSCAAGPTVTGRWLLPGNAASHQRCRPSAGQAVAVRGWCRHRLTTAFVVQAVLAYDPGMRPIVVAVEAARSKAVSPWVAFLRRT